MLSESTINKLWDMVFWLRSNWRGALGCAIVGLFAGLVLVTLLAPEAAQVPK